jgi:hypothetical protein
MPLANFKAIIDTNDLSRSNRFRISGAGTPGSENNGDLNELLQTVPLPGIQFSTAARRDIGPPRMFPYDIIYAELPLTFLDTPHHDIKNFYDNWMQGENNPNAVYRNTGFGYMDEYRRDFEIHKLDREGNTVHRVHIFNSYPVSTEAIALDTSAQNALTIVAVNMVYERWSVIEVPRAKTTPAIPAPPPEPPPPNH